MLDITTLKMTYKKFKQDNKKFKKKQIVGVKIIYITNLMHEYSI